MVLSRKRGQRVAIGKHVVVTVLEVRDDRVKLGFVAPPEMPVHREEVFWRIEGHLPPAAHAACW